MAGLNHKPAKFSLDDEPDGLVFSQGHKNAYYANALRELFEHGGVLTFRVPSRNLKTQVRRAARKAGFIVTFAESDGAVYVKILGEFDPETDEEA